MFLYRRFSLVLLTFLIACSSIEKSNINSASYGCFDLKRTPSAYNYCRYWIEESAEDTLPGVSTFATEIIKEPTKRARMEQINAAIAKNKQLAPPVAMTKAMEAFRKKMLPLIKFMGTNQEPLIRTMEAYLRARSHIALNRIKRKKDSPENYFVDYDFVIVGAGIHGIIALHKILKERPDAKVLIIEESNSIASNFREAGDMFSINSSNRASGEGRTPLPGQGNINELPGFPIQVSDLTFIKYPTAGNLAATLTIAAYAGLVTNKNVDIVFGQKADFFTESQRGQTGTQERIRTHFVGTLFNTEVVSNGVIVATGLGRSTVPDGTKEALEQSKPRNNTTEPEFPKVMTFDQFLSTAARRDSPLAEFAGKTVSIYGTGDSSKVVIEALIGAANPNAYGLDGAQVGLVKKIYWHGQDAKTCEEYIAKERSRYSPIGTAYRSSDPNSMPILEAVPEKVDSTRFVGNEIQTVGGSRGVISDYVISATGQSSGLMSLFRNLIPGSFNTRDLNTFLEDYFVFINGRTTTSSTDTRVGRTLPDNRNIILVGPGAGRLPLESELVGIIQNTVSIFNNAPRTVAAVESLLNNIKEKVSDRPSDTKVKLEPGNLNQYYFVITSKQQERRPLNESSDIYLKGSLDAVLDNFIYGRSRTATLEFYVKGNNSRIYIDATGDVNVSQVISALKSINGFFDTLSTTLRLGDKKRLQVQVNIDSGRVDNIELFFLNLRTPQRSTGGYQQIR